MKQHQFMCVSVLLVFLVFIPLSALAGLVTGPAARVDFEQHRDHYLDMFLDFESIASGLHSSLPLISSNHILLTTKTFKLATKTFRFPLPETAAPPGTKVAVLPYNFITTPLNHRLMGVRAGNIPDGQSMYEIIFNNCLDRVGLKRMWNTSSITRFYQQNRLLAEHKNATDYEFVGYIVDPNNPNDDCVTRVVFDGYPLQPDDENNKLYMVGEVDDLFYSVPAIASDLLLKNDGKVLAGDSMEGFLCVQHFGSYPIYNAKITVEYLDHASQNNIKNAWDVYVEKEGGKCDPLIDIKTTETTRSGYYKIRVTIHSSADVLVEDKIHWYYVNNPKLSFPVTNIIAPFLLKADPD